MSHNSMLCASGETGRRSGLKIPCVMVSTEVLSCSPPPISAFFPSEQVANSCARVRRVPGRSAQLALVGHRLTTFRSVACALVLASVAAFFGSLKRRGFGCLEVSDGIDIDQARQVALSIAGVRSRLGVCQLTARCVRPAHIEVAS